MKSQASFIFEDKVHTEQEIEKVVEEIANIKNISSPNFISKLKLILIKLNYLNKIKKELSSFYEEKINKDNKSHMNMLYDIWSHFNENDTNIKDIDDKWRKYKYINNIFYNIVKVGFQGKDPLTDFRGSGLLGLKHLWQFSKYDLRAGNVFKVATDVKTWYFYAATGINITGKVIQFIEEGKCDKYFYDNEINLYNFTQSLYNEFFVGFNNMWIEKGYTDFMKVNTSLEEFMEKRAKDLYVKLITKKVF